MNRNNFSQLPDSGELQNILNTEVNRNLPPGKEGEHYFDFSPLIKMARHFGVSAQLLAQDFSKEDAVNEQLFEKGKAILEELKENILDNNLSHEDIEAMNAVYDYLAEEDIPKKSDLIFVFGAKTSLRIEKAVELFNKKISERIVLSGKGPHYGKNSDQTEAVIYAQIAIDKGIPAKAILIEDKSITIPDNVRSSLNLLDNRKISYNSIILVNSPYTQRRGWAHFKKYLPDDVKLIRVNCETGDQYKRDYWYKSPVGIDVVIGEYLKAKVAVSLNTA